MRRGTGLNLLREGAIGGILDRLPVLISYTDAEGRFQYANTAMLNACGSPLDMPAGVHARDVLGERIYARVTQHMERAVRGEAVTFMDANDASEQLRHLELTFIPDQDTSGRVHGYIGIGYDLTDRIEREGKLAAREQHLSSILHTMAEGLVIHDREGALVEANPAAEQLLHLTRSELFEWDVAHPHWEVVDEDGDVLEPDQIPVIRALRSGMPVRGEVAGIRIPGLPTRWLKVNAQPLYDGRDPRPSGVVGTFADITALRDSMERIRGLAQRVEDVREKERRDLALLLHEGLAQDLFAMQLTLSSLQREWPESYGSALDELSRVLDRCLADVRQVAGGLRPTGSVNRPIGQAIAEHARYFEGIANLAIHLHVGDTAEIRDEPTRLLLFRSAQEALSNVARHARATRVDLHLEIAGSHVELRVSDNGVGLAEGALDKAGSLGLLGLRERTRSVDGVLEIQRNEAGGTTILLRLPLVPPQAEPGAQHVAPPRAGIMGA